LEISLKSKTFIEHTYEQMRSANVVRNSEDFSTEFLGKSKSYFRAMKAKGLEANTGMLTHLANELNSRRTLFEKVGEGNIDFYYEKWRKIEDDIANELALRATANGSINTHALQSVLSAIQTLITQRQPLTT
jgi:hypothetical protein